LTGRASIYTVTGCGILYYLQHGTLVYCHL